MIQLGEGGEGGNTITCHEYVLTYAACSPCDEEFVVSTGRTQDLPIVQALEDCNGL